MMENKYSVTYYPFFISTLGAIVNGKDINELDRIDGDVPYITATLMNNGVGDYVQNINATLEKI